ncbi:MAG TPA: chlorite dismutase family protein [Propionicimonas sp.]|jgi:chlorite dismutase
MTEGRVRTREIDQGIRSTGWAVFGHTGPASERLLEALQRAPKGWDPVVVRGCYDVSGLRASSDIMLWLHGPTTEALQIPFHTGRLIAASETTDVLS